MPGSDLADRAAALLSLAAATEERSLSQLTALAASQVPGAIAANVTVWRGGELAGQAASHPEASALIDVELASGRGPIVDATTSGGAATCVDTLIDTRWPEFASAAVEVGVRSALAVSYRGTVVITLALYGVRPRVLDSEQLTLAELLVAYGGDLVGAVSDYGDSRRVAVQLRDAAEARAVVDQAKGILMHALGCSADDALERMREVSQRSNLRATEVARRVIDAHGRPGDRAGPDELSQLAELSNRPRRAQSRRGPGRERPG